MANEKEKQELLTQLAKGATLDEIQNQLAILEKRNVFMIDLKELFQDTSSAVSLQPTSHFSMRP